MSEEFQQADFTLVVENKNSFYHLCCEVRSKVFTSSLVMGGACQDFNSYFI